MSDTSLPWRLFGRLIRPYALALTASLLSVWFVSIRHAEALDEMHSRNGHTVGWIALGVAAILAVGWLRGSERMMRFGLLASTGVWSLLAAVAAYIAGPLSIFALISACWVLASGGAFLVEEAHARVVSRG